MLYWGSYAFFTFCYFPLFSLPILVFFYGYVFSFGGLFFIFIF